jgi:enhancing lycopene biosynthesis protein 2
MRAAVILSGCGVFDGSEIQEAVLCFLTLKEYGYNYDCYAPDRKMTVISHLTKKPAGERNVLEESARIARGDIHDLHQLDSSKYDLLVIPGGLGVGKNLSTFVEEQDECDVLIDLTKVVEFFFDAKKPIVAICMGPVILAKVLSSRGSFKLTLGKSPENMAILKKMGMEPVPTSANEMVQDGNIYTAPGYYEASSLDQIYESLRKIFDAL